MTQPMTQTPHRKFSFDTVFDDAGAVISEPQRAKTSYTPEEVEIERRRAFAEGERTVTARAEQAQAQAMSEIARAVEAALPALTRIAHDHRIAAAQLALACGKAIAGAALDAFPEAPLTATFEALAREVETYPRLIVRARPEQAERVKAALNHVAHDAGFPGQIEVKGDQRLEPAAFVLEWADGRASFDPVQAAQRVETALNDALAAEGLHAEPLVPHTS